METKFFTDLFLAQHGCIGSLTVVGPGYKTHNKYFFKGLELNRYRNL